MTTTRLALPFALLLTLVLAGCTTARPVLYPNRHLDHVGPTVAEEDIDACLARARDAGLDYDRAARTAAQTGAGAATGAAVGAAVGAVRGRPGLGAAAGGAGGGVRGLMRGLFRSRDPDRLQARFVEFCLRDQGYRILGWR